MVNILKWIGYIFLALVVMGVILGIMAFLMFVKVLIAAVMILAFIALMIKSWFDYRKEQKAR